ncbi:MAG: M20 metallopeptidase family protein [Acholeplasmataceae bacterium]
MDKLKHYRQTLHQIPEVAFKEYKTHDFLVKTLQGIGFQTQTYLETDVIVFIDRKASKTIAFRSDIDGLPQEEKTQLSFQSKHEGRMHACGHDAHMSMLLTFAHYLKEHLHELTVNVLLIFQPAEEHIGGAKRLIEAGLFKDHPVDAIFGIHVYPELEEFLITSKSGYFMAQANELTINIHGKSAHGAMPELGIDANHIASLYLTTVYERIKTLNQTMRVICTFGKLTGGTVKNIISEKATLEGTMRTYTKDEYDTVSLILQETKQSLERTYGCDIGVTIHDGYLPVYNDPTLYETFKSLMDQKQYVEMDQPLLIAEDFSFYQREVPGVFFFIGTRNEDKGYIHSLHSSYFNLDEDALITGVESYIKILNHYMT